MYEQNVHEESINFDLKEEYLSHISLLMHKYIRINGKYKFDLSINEEKVFKA
jgi:stress response protein SCP2